MNTRSMRIRVAVSAVLLVTAASVSAQTITSPKQQFGFNIGDDYQLATYTQFVEYWQKLDRESDRMKVVEIGKTAEGRPQLMAIITSPQNHKNLERYKEISRRLATAEGLTDEQARALAREGKGVVWIDGGLHATEVLGAHQLIETVYQLVSRTDPETMRFLNDLVILAVHANPDGMELVSSWYMRNPVAEQRGTGPGIPRLYQKYIGHDNNRDFYLSSQAESTNLNRVMYLEWFPQIMYNHHQTGPAGTVMFAPPFRDPFNYNFDPLDPGPARSGGRGNAQPLCHGRQARGHEPEGLELFDVVERRPADHGLLPQHDRSADGDNRQPDAGQHPVPAAAAPSGLEPALSDRAAGHLAFPPVHRLFTHGELCGLRHRLPEQGELPLQHLSDGEELDRAGKPGQLDADAAPCDCGADRARWRPRGAGRHGRVRRRRGGCRRTRRPGRRIGRLQASAPRSGDPRSARIHPAGGPGGFSDRNQVRQRADQDAASRSIAPRRRSASPARTIRPGRTSSSRRRPSARTCWTCSSHRIIRTTSHIPAVRRPVPTTTPGGRSPIRWACNSIACWTASMVRSRRSADCRNRRPAGSPARPAAGFVMSHAANDSFTAINRLLASGEEVTWITSGPSAGAFFITSKASTRATLDKLAVDLGLSFEAGPRPAGDAMPPAQIAHRSGGPIRRLDAVRLDAVDPRTI